MARWSPAQIDTLRRCRSQGLSYKVCARRLRRTRNSCIGKARRETGHRTMQPAEIVKANEWSMRQAWSQSRRVAPPPPPSEGHNVLAFKPSPKRRPVALLDLAPGACRWPLGDTRDRNFGYCGCASAEGSSYCAEHRALAYQPRAKAA